MRGPCRRPGAAEILREREAVELRRLTGGAEERAVATRRREVPSGCRGTAAAAARRRADGCRCRSATRRGSCGRCAERGFEAAIAPSGIEISSASSAPPRTSAPVTAAARTTAGPTGLPTRSPSGVTDVPGVGDPEIAVDEPPEVVAVLLVERIMKMKRFLRLGNLVRRRLLHVHEEARRVGRDRLVERERQEAEDEQQDDRRPEPAEREAEGRHRAPRGSKASRRPSPNSVSASTVRKIAALGRIVSHGENVVGL